MSFDNRGARAGAGPIVNRKDSYAPQMPIPRSNPEVALEESLAKEGRAAIAKDLDAVATAWLRMMRQGVSRKGFLRIPSGPKEEWE